MPTIAGGESAIPTPGGRNLEEAPSHREDQLNPPAIAPWVSKSLEDELALFDGLSDFSTSTEHVIVLKNDRPI